jgi:hypothetical protein
LQYLSRIFIFLGLFFGVIISAVADGGFQVIDVQISHIFNEQLGIHATVEPFEQINQVTVLIQFEDENIFAEDLMTLSQSGEIYQTYNLTQKPIPPFTNLIIWFEAKYKDGTTYTSESFSYFYDDNRFQWKSLKTEEFTIYWYQDTYNLGQEIKTSAYEGLTRIQNLIKVPIVDGIKIFAYSSVEEMQDTLLFSGGSTSWVAGHADSDLGVIIVSLPPGPQQKQEIQRQIPHELMHVLLNEKLGAGYSNLPRWLNEGLASSSELALNSDFQLLLDTVYDRDALIPVSDLCTIFLTDAASFQLSYAESYAFTQFLQQTYGNNKMEELLQAYSNGVGCDQGVANVFGSTLPELEEEWRQVMFNEIPFQDNLNESFPLIIVLGFAFIVPIGMLVINVNKRGKGQKI